MEMYKIIAKWYQRCFDRVLPLSEMVVDRYEKARMLGFGVNASIHDSAHVYGHVHVGADTWVGPFTILDGSGARLIIGKHCSIAAGVQIYTHDTIRWAISRGKDEFEYGPVTIGDNCYIGPNVVICRDVEIGEGCIIGANSVVITSIPPNSRAHGAPATLRGKASENA